MKDGEKLLLLGGLAYLLLREYGTSSFTSGSLGPGTPYGGQYPYSGVQPIGVPGYPSTGSQSQYPLSAAIGAPIGNTGNIGTKDIQTVAATPVQAAANQEVNAVIAQQNQELNSVTDVSVAALGTLSAAGIAAVSVTGPIAVALIGIVELVKAFVSDTHLVANEMVSKYENPFGNFFIQVIQAVTNELNNHTLSLHDATAAYQALATAWQNYEDTCHQLQGTSTDWYIVATQSLNNLDNQYMGVTLPNGKTLGSGEGGVYGNTPNYGFVSSWLDWLKGLITGGSLS